MNKKLRKTRGRVFGSRLTATVSISLVLLLFAIMTTLGFFARELSQTAKENICVTVLLEDDITPTELTAFQKMVSQAEWTKKYQYIDKESALKELTEELGESPEKFLGFNPLPATIEIQMNSEFTQMEQIRKIVSTLSAPSYVQEVVYREDLIQLVNKNILSIGKLLLTVAVVLTLISFMLIRNTVRLMIYSKRFLIHTMCLVGARRSFIRRPFVRQNVLCGIISALLALGLYYLTLSAMDSVFPGISRMVTAQMYWAILALLLGLGILISAVATVFSVNRFLKMSNDELYYV
ncbi:MAG: permease-like cell division protein FtsX [Bacteroidales bacterium]|nr:permease-like cell division protein FtsX [Bacteroidales bacterium]